MEFEGQTFTADDFYNGTKPFELVYAYENGLARKQALERLARAAKDELKLTGVKKMYAEYEKLLKAANNSIAMPDDNFSQFDCQIFEQKTGSWTADDTGIWRMGAMGAVEYACTHPIMPVRRLRNIDTGELKVELWFRRGNDSRKIWHETVQDFDTIANAKNILSLAKLGVSVTSGRRAQALVDFLNDVMDFNYDEIPEHKSVSRMGWNSEGFSPYVDGAIFDGNQGFKRIYEALKPCGSFDAWRAEASEVRKFSLTARIVLAASFAAPLIQKLGLLPFFVHLWGGDSGTGKSVAQMVAASVWGNPHIGGAFFQTFRSTSTGMEILASFLHNIPLFLDELQLSKDHRGRPLFNVYELAAGAGKQRSNIRLGLNGTPTWHNCFITSGETPLVNANDGSGALNRVIEVECTSGGAVIENGRKTAGIVRENYGHAGRMFVERLMQDGEIENVKQLYEAIYTDCTANGTAGKQAMAAAVIILADNLASHWVFGDDTYLEVEDLAEFMKTSTQISIGARGYEYLCDWVVANSTRFMLDIPATSEMYGLIAIDDETGDETAFIKRYYFNKACEEGELSPRALLSYLKAQGLIRTRGARMTVGRRIGGANVECVALTLPKNSECGS